MAAMHLLADVGGTRSRYTLSDGPGRLGPVLELATASAPPEQLLSQALVQLAPDRSVTEARVAIAGPVESGAGQLTNLPWRFDAEALAAASGLSQVRLMNDFVAVARSLPLLETTDSRLLGGPATGVAGAPMVALGPGTGLGVAAAMPLGDGHWTALPGEGGHVTLAARNETEWHVLSSLSRELGHVSAERVCSGPGISALYGTLEAKGDATSLPDPAEIAVAAARGEARARTCIDLFADFLGTVAADAALTLGALGGVFLAGGVIPRLGKAFDADRFHRRFLDKGRFREYLERIPVRLLTHPQPGLLGLSANGGEET